MRDENILLVGLGGAGLRTLEEFDTLIAGDSSLQDLREDNLYYLVVDANRNSMAGFESGMRKRSDGQRMPYVRNLFLPGRLSGNELNAMLSAYFRSARTNGEKSPGYMRLCENFWTDLHGLPMCDWMLDGVPVMRGPHPTESYALAWYKMGEIRKAVRDAVAEMCRRNEMSAINGLRVYFVAGLADRTGRGCWAHVMLKIKETLCGQYGVNVPTTGLFFDAGTRCYYVNGVPTVTLSDKVNSLTGLSELSAWMRNGKSKNPVEIRLPSLRTPEDLTSDVLKVGEGCVLNACSPVDTAYLIGGRCFDRYKEYYKMAASALYGMIDGHFDEALYAGDGATEPFLVNVTCQGNVDDDVRTHPFDAIRCLDYWKEESVVCSSLRMVERDDGGMVVNREPIGLTNVFLDMGYISPRFVREPRLSALRWKPWVDLTSESHNRAHRHRRKILHNPTANDLNQGDDDGKEVKEN